MSYMKNLFTKQALLTGLLVMAVVVLFGYSSYAMFMRVDRYDPIQAMSFGNLGVSFAVAPASGIPNHIALLNSNPVDDVSATQNSYDLNKFAFALTNYGTEKSDYKVFLVDLTLDDIKDATSKIDISNQIDHEYIKVQVDGGEIKRLSELENGFICSGEVISGDENIIYHDLRVWISSDYTGDIKDVNLKLVFESVLQSENIKKLSITNHVIENNDVNESFDLSKNEVGNDSGLFLNKNSNTYFFRGVVDNNNIVLKNSDGENINFKILSFNYDEMKIVLSNSTMIKELKCLEDNIDDTLFNWYENFYNNNLKKIIISDEGKMYSNITYNDINLAGMIKDTPNKDFFLSAKINYWVLDNDDSYVYSESKGLVSSPSNTSFYVLPILKIDGKLAYSAGNGTIDSPYEFTVSVN